MTRDVNLSEWEMCCQDRRPAPPATCPICGWFSDVYVDGVREWHSPAYVMAFSSDFQLPDSYTTLFEGCGDRECFRAFTIYAP